VRLARIIESARLLIERPTSEKVYRIQFAITWKCQLACEMCNIWKKSNENEMALDDIKRVFSNRRFLKSLKTIDITGGEPFLRSDLAQIIEYFSAEFPKAKILITTNGYSTKQIESLGKKILGACPPDKLEFSVSIDGPEKIHDKIRGKVGSYQNALESIEILKKLGAKKITLSTTITKENRGSLMYVYNLAQSLGVRFATARFAQSSFYYENPSLNMWSHDELKDVEREIDALIKARRAREGISLRLLRDAYFLKKAISFQKNCAQKERCFSGTHSFFIDPNGNIYPCVMLDKPMGNALGEDLEKIWFSERAREIRDSIVKGNCSCHTECETFLSMQRNVKDILKILFGALRT